MAWRHAGVRGHVTATRRHTRADENDTVTSLAMTSSVGLRGWLSGGGAGHRLMSRPLWGDVASVIDWQRTHTRTRSCRAYKQRTPVGQYINQSIYQSIKKFDAHCCHVGTAIKHAVPDRVKSSFVIFDIRALWRSGNSGCQRVNTLRGKVSMWARVPLSFPGRWLRHLLHSSQYSTPQIGRRIS